MTTINNNNTSTSGTVAKATDTKKTACGSFSEVTFHELVGSKYCKKWVIDPSRPQTESDFERGLFDDASDIVSSNKYASKSYILGDWHDTEAYADYLREFIIMQALVGFRSIPHIFSDKLSKDMTIDMQYFKTNLHDMTWSKDPETKYNAGINLDNLCEDVGNALNFMHASGIYHGDIKPDNILYNGETGVFALCDFNKSMFRRYQTMKDRWCKEFVDPRLRSGARYSAKNDMYSLAATIYYYITGGIYMKRPSNINARFRDKYHLPKHIYEYMTGLVSGKDRYMELFSDAHELTNINYEVALSQPSDLIIGMTSPGGGPIDENDIEELQNAIDEMWEEDQHVKVKPRYVKAIYDSLEKAGIDFEELEAEDYAALYYMFAVICKDIVQFSGYKLTERSIDILNKYFSIFISDMPCNLIKNARRI